MPGITTSSHIRERQSIFKEFINAYIFTEADVDGDPRPDPIALLADQGTFHRALALEQVRHLGTQVVHGRRTSLPGSHNILYDNFMITQYIIYMTIS